MRSIAKTLSYGTMHLTVAIAVAYALTGDWQVALGVGIVEPMVQTFAYTLHERLWSPKTRTEAQAAEPILPHGPIAAC